MKTVLRTSQAGRRGKVAQLGSNLLQTMHLIADILGLNWRRHSMMGLQEKRKSSLPRSVYFNFLSSYPPTRPPSSPKELHASRCSRLSSPEHFSLQVGLWKNTVGLAFADYLLPHLTLLQDSPVCVSFSPENVLQAKWFVR